MMALSWKIKQARLDAGLSQNTLGLRLGYTSGQFISNVERGVMKFPLSKLKNFARITGADKRELVEAYAEDARQLARKTIGINA